MWNLHSSLTWKWNATIKEWRRRSAALGDRIDGFHDAGFSLEMWNLQLRCPPLLWRPHYLWLSSFSLFLSIYPSIHLSIYPSIHPPPSTVLFASIIFVWPPTLPLRASVLTWFQHNGPFTRDLQSTNTFNDSLKNTHSRLLNVYFIHHQSTNSLPNVNQKLLSTKKLTLTCYDATKCLQNVYQGRLSP